MAVLLSNSTEELFTVTRGDVSDFIYVRPSILDGGTIDGNWTCTAQVVKDNGNVVVDSYTVTEKSGDNTEFKVYLTSEQTQSIPGGLGDRVHEYIWMITLDNQLLTPANTRTLRLRLGVSGS